ncbi:hypothetical protein I7I53_10544 [Histoplasma capsulatum var. duboisii H88]|uniref:DUF7730 domain-containing protein n=1 Tax=Ajellomyces capsulatus (strain H88) TaxID=544711 RepID=A0A8A1LBF2_AJEC8|nr:hypothetical protein I7I53_10544 [Histoplasma capsulatum var. duboisii H88]
MRKFFESLHPHKLLTSKKRQKRSIDHDSCPINGQSSFPFFSLPPEIRNQIYFALFSCDQAIHLFHVKENLYLLRCRQSTPHLDGTCCPHLSLADGAIPSIRESLAKISHCDDTCKSRIKTPHSALAHLPTSILYANKQLYNEAAAVLYSELSFEASELKTWILFARMVSPHHLALVKRLWSTWIGLPCLTMAPVRPGATGYASYEQYTLWDEPWDEFWAIVSSRMDGLVELGFCMNYDAQYLDRSTEAKWLEPMLTVRGLRNLDVWVRDRIGGQSNRRGEDEPGAKREGEALVQFLKGIMCQGKLRKLVDGTHGDLPAEVVVGGEKN